jgi:hypothetical protein
MALTYESDMNRLSFHQSNPDPIRKPQVLQFIRNDRKSSMLMLHWTFTIPELMRERERERERGEDKSTMVYGSTKRWQN